jgi:hypothetical protein
VELHLFVPRFESEANPKYDDKERSGIFLDLVMLILYMHYKLVPYTASSSPHPSSTLCQEWWKLGKRAMTYRIGSGRLRSTGLPRNNDLIHREHSSCSLSSKFDRPTFRDHQIKDTFLLSIESTSVVLVL